MSHTHTRMHSSVALPPAADRFGVLVVVYHRGPARGCAGSLREYGATYPVYATIRLTVGAMGCLGDGGRRSHPSRLSYASSVAARCWHGRVGSGVRQCCCESAFDRGTAAILGRLDAMQRSVSKRGQSPRGQSSATQDSFRGTAMSRSRAAAVMPCPENDDE